MAGALVQLKMEDGEHVTVLFQQETEEFPHVMAHNVHFEPLDHTRILDRFIADIQTDDLFQRQHMCPTQIEVRILRRKTVKVRAADSREQQRIRLCGDDAMKAGVNGHCALTIHWKLNLNMDVVEIGIFQAPLVKTHEAARKRRHPYLLAFGYATADSLKFDKAAAQFDYSLFELIRNVVKTEVGTTKFP